jgi:hypothetical protein
MSNPVINELGDKYWYNNMGELHRVDGPAVEYTNGNKYWFLNGSRIYSLYPDGRTYKGDMNNIPLVMKQSIIEHTLKL